MADELSWASVLAWRMARQGLQRRVPAADWPQVVARICGLHAQVHSSAELTLWARVDDLAPDAVTRALRTDRTLVKTWAMRGTLHLLPAGELATWVGAQGALRPRYETASWRKAFGMSSAEAVALLDAIRTALAGEPMTRDELADAVAAQLGDARLGEAVRGSWGTMPKLAAFAGDVCFAPPAGQKVRFTRPDRWLGDGWAPAAAHDAMAEVVRRHLAAYGPASRESFARWFGMSSAAQAGKLVTALGDEVAAVSVEGREGWMLADDVAAAARAVPSGSVALLPAFDQYVVAAPREDSPALATEHRARVYRPQGWLSPVVLVDGRMEGVWRHERKGGRLTVRIEPFGAADEQMRAKAEAQARRLAAFLGGELELQLSWA
ncbi:MAG: winged helix DNA-binding domain-containing protein [Solirubrobacteraceae bacterium]